MMVRTALAGMMDSGLIGKGLAFVIAAAVIGAAGGASAQRSLFDTPTAPTPAQSPEPPPALTPAPAPAPIPAPAAAPAARVQAEAKPKPKKPRGPVPAGALTVNNAGTSTLASLEVSADGKSAKLTRPLGPKKRTTLKLPGFKSCQVSVAATFEGAAPESSEVDICKEKTLRFTE